MKPTVAIYSAAGQALASVEWNHGSIVGLGWTGDEKLIIVESTGEVGSPCFFLSLSWSRINLPPPHPNETYT